MLDWLNSAEPHKELAARRESGWLAQHLPEVYALYGVPQTAAHHPEICTGAHIELCLAVAAALTGRFDVRFAVLTHDLGKALTPQEEWPRHVDHEHSGMKPLERVCARLGLAGDVRKLALLVCEYHLHSHRFFEMNDTSVVKFLDKTGLLYDAALAEGFFLACESDARGRLGKHDNPYSQGVFARAAIQAVREHPYPAGVTMQDPEGNRIHASRVQAVRRLREALAPPKAAPAC